MTLHMSFSTAKLLNPEFPKSYCPRAWYWKVFGSKRDDDQGDLARTLKPMVGAWGLAGTLFHSFAADCIRSCQEGTWPDMQCIADHYLEQYRQVPRNHLDRKYEDDPRRFPPLHQLWYGGEKYIDSGYLALVEAIDGWMSSDFCQTLMRGIIRGALIVLECEQLRSMELSGAKVWLVVDLAIYNPAKDQITIIDWKSGKVGNLGIEEQLGLYAMYMMEATASHDDPAVVLCSDIVGLAHFVTHDVTRLVADTSSAMVAGAQHIQTRIDHAKTLVNSDGSPRSVERFYQNKKACWFCQYKELCR